MHIIAIVNQKGGCGKTTTAINLCATLGQQDARVLLVDMDPQGHAALGLGVAGAELAGLYEVLKGEHRLEDVIQAGVAPGVDLVAGNIALAAAEHLLADQPERDRQLKQHLGTVAARYDCVILDCPPALGMLSVNALRCADRVVIPVEPSLYSMDGIERLRETIHLLEDSYDIRPSVVLLANMFDNRTRIARSMLEMLESQLPVDLCRTRIRNSVRVREAACHGAPLTAHAPRAPVTGDFRDLAEELAGSLLQRVRSAPARAAATPAATPPAAADDDLREVVFRFDFPEGQRVQIAGEFNNWIPDKDVETEVQDGALRKILRVSPGGYEYRLVIDGVWQQDPANPEAAPNDLGGYNSLLHV
ncbi:MAG: AAA family ATPase [Gammaproteobacteria bacterium]